ncbi:hypothetical protein NDU88_001151 [Pleurodeles waltl]|uniref:Uncharacterized protein n=1 Tax=Pleurodeles waltl TaxID=8319 RepID=A0AAV7P4W7_PLEWA|nr:hypothetical protein NDU88_001151 [Pleurodeles waltl]
MDYRQECLRLLSDTTYYAPLTRDPTKMLLSQIKAMVEEAKTFCYYASTQCILLLSEGYASLRCLISTWDGRPIGCLTLTISLRTCVHHICIGHCIWTRNHTAADHLPSFPQNLQMSELLVVTLEVTETNQRQKQPALKLRQSGNMQHGTPLT